MHKKLKNPQLDTWAQLQNAILKEKEASAFLGEFSAFWMLSLDMVPMTSQQTVQLHVNRGCNCVMEAWVSEKDF
ncbi:hypothetical protein niasHT_022935 [Heterodera trifolii]|uniref:Uncharacterized protein n=1 Tax=Heterodera trifolii TaxID=157864 RepID=A0ABD2KFM5_9BILA